MRENLISNEKKRKVNKEMEKGTQLRKKLNKHQ